MNPDQWMQMAIEEARKGIADGQTPFGAVIVKDGKLVSAAHNEVWHRCNPTAHAEILAIHSAAEKLGTIDLTGCEIFTTCEPCPMCASAIHWAKIATVHHGATIADAQQAGFSELSIPCAELYRLGGSGVRVSTATLQSECAALFQEWLGRADRRGY